jgi:penicillin-binding protein-related factor A (putative recombinase)
MGNAMNFKRRGSETGSSFQEAINRTNEAYERAGRACVTRKAIPGKYLVEWGGTRRGLSLPSLTSTETNSSSGQARISTAQLSGLIKEHKSGDWRRFVPESKAEPDYGGVIAPDGRAIFYDAKSTRRDLMDFDNLHEHQVNFLDCTVSFGAVAGFLIEFSRYGKIYFLPIQALMRWRQESTRKSLPYQFFADHLIPAPPGKGFIVFDYLTAIAEQERRYGRDFSGFDQVSFDVYAKRTARKIAST